MQGLLAAMAELKGSPLIQATGSGRSCCIDLEVLVTACLAGIGKHVLKARLACMHGIS